MVNLYIASKIKRFNKDQVRSFYYRCRRFQTIFRGILPFDQIIKNFWFSLNCCNYSFDFIDKDRTHTGFYLKSFNKILSLMLSSFAITFNLFKKDTALHIFVTRAAIFVFGEIYVVWVFWTIVLWVRLGSHRSIFHLLNNRIKLDPLLVYWSRTWVRISLNTCIKYSSL